MASVFSTPQTISGKVKTRTPTQAQALSSRYTFLNLQNAEPNLGAPGTTTGTSPESYEGHLGLRYALLSNNTQNGLSAWRVWSFDNPRVAFYSVENSLAIGENANPIRINSIVYNNHPYGTNRYNSESLAENSFNVYALSGIYLFDSTTIGDPASAVTFVVTESGNVGIGTENPCELLTVAGNVSAQSLTANSFDGWHLLHGKLVTGDDTCAATGIYSHAEGSDTGASGGYAHSEGLTTYAIGDASHSEGIFCIADGDGCNAGGLGTLASGHFSFTRGQGTVALGFATHAMGAKSTAAHDYSFIWSDGNLSTLSQNVSTTRTGQFAVSASGGVFIPGNVGIGTDNNSNSLTVAGLISGSNIALSNANITNLISATASGDFITLNINGVNRAIRLWDY